MYTTLYPNGLPGVGDDIHEPVSSLKKTSLDGFGFSDLGGESVRYIFFFTT